MQDRFRGRHRLARIFLGGVLFALVSSLLLPGKIQAYQSFLNKARKYGAKDCRFCHKNEDGGDGWNERGQWLIDQKDKRKADKIDVDWLIDFKPEEGEKKDKPAEKATPAAPLREPVKVGAAVQESQLIYRVDPVIPESVKRIRVSGTTILEAIINESGEIYELKIRRSGHPLMQSPVWEAVKQWRYEPTLLNGVPVPVSTIITVSFNPR